jgi:carboxymethylenebutenolidase
MRRVTDKIASEGYVAIAPELFHRTAPTGAEYPYGDFNLVMPHFQGLSTDGLLADIKASYDWLHTQQEVIHEKIGSIGFCLGGRVSFLANTVVPLSAGISYYGGGLAALADRAAQVHAPHLFFWGGLDKHITPDQVETIIAAMHKAGKPFVNTVFSYADHAFNCDDRPNYNPEASAEAWAMAMAFFRNKFGK